MIGTKHSAEVHAHEHRKQNLPMPEACGDFPGKAGRAAGHLPQAVSRWETDEAVPDIEKVVRLSHIFGVSTDYLLLDEQEEAASPLPSSSEAMDTGIPSTAVLERRRRFRIVFGLSLLILGLGISAAALILAGIWAAHATQWWTAYGAFGTGLFGWPDDLRSRAGDRGICRIDQRIPQNGLKNGATARFHHAVAPFYVAVIIRRCTESFRSYRNTRSPHWP